MAVEFVQSAQGGQEDGDAFTITFTDDVTAGNCVVACINLPQIVTAVYLGTTANSFTLLKEDGDRNNGIYILYDAPAGESVIYVTYSENYSFCYGQAMEFSGVATSDALDQSAAADSTGLDWSTGATGTTTQANEVWVGTAFAYVAETGNTIAGPGSPWTNLASRNNNFDSQTFSQISGYQVTSATGTATYSGTNTKNDSTATYSVVVTLLPAAQALTTTGSLGATPTLTVEAERGQSASASLGATPSLTAETSLGHSASASLDASPSLTATAAHGHVAVASLNATPTLTATAAAGDTASLNATPTLTAQAVRGQSASASLDATPATSALVGGAASASLSVTPSLSVETSHGHAASASLNAGPALTAGTSHGHTASASLDASPSLSAATRHGTAHAVTASLNATPTLTAQASRGQSATASLNATPSLSATTRHGTAHTITASLGATPSLTASASKGNQRQSSASLDVTPSLTAGTSHGHAVTGSLDVTPALTVTDTPPFPASVLDLRCELQLGSTWTDVTSYVYQRDGAQAPVVITRGRPDESSQANPASCTWQWNNRDGRFSPQNPLSDYYGQLGRNTPVRWSVPAPRSYLRLEPDTVGAYASCPSSSGLDVTGSIEVRVELRLSDWNNCDLVSKYDGTTASSWIINTQDDGTLQFWWRDSGGTLWEATSTVPVPFTTGDFALRFTLDADTGTVTYYTSTSIDGTWTQLGDTVSPTGGSSTSIYSGDVQVTAGYSVNNDTWQTYGRIYGFRVYDGIGGTVVADAGFDAQAAGTTSWTDSESNDWSLSGGATIDDRDYRFHGEMSSQPPRWDATGTDMYVAAQAGGPLRRLSQATNNIMSAMRRAIMSFTGDLVPVAYWPMEDGTDAGQFGAAIGYFPMTFDSNPAPTLATDETFNSSLPLPELNGSRLQAPIAPYTSTGAWTVRFLLKGSTSDSGTLIRIVAADGAVVYLNMSDNDLQLIVYAPDGTQYSTTNGAYPGVGTGVWCSMEATAASGGGVEYSLATLEPGATDGNVFSVTVSDETAGAGSVALVQVAPQAAFTSTVIGHLTVQSTITSIFALGQPLNAWTGETAAARYSRLAAENSFNARILGPPDTSALMGPQSADTLSDLLQECETADLGQQFEPRQALAIGYRTLGAMCGQSPVLTLDYSAAELGGVSEGGDDSGLDVTYDDQFTRNDWTLTRGSASSSTQGATWEYALNDGSAMSVSAPPTGVGEYADTQTVNCEYDQQLQDTAGWMVHTGTVNEARWPVIPVNLARSEAAALTQDAMNVDIGDMIEVDNLPTLITYDPVKQIAFGVTESLGGFHWTMEYNAVPETPYETLVLGDAVYGRVDTDGSTLDAAATATATTLSVSTASGYPLWTTSSSDFPFDVNVAGERITVTAISGSSSPQTFTVTRAVNGVSKAQTAGTAVSLWFPPVLAMS